MERSYFYNDQDVMADDLNAIEGSINKQSASRSVAVLGYSGGVSLGTGGSVNQGGIYGSPADYLVTTKNLYPSKSSATEITIASGSAMDHNGNLILVPSAFTITFTDDEDEKVWKEATSGVKTIKIKYRESSGSVQSDDEGNQFYTRYYDSYQVVVEVASASVEEIPLGYFTADSSGHITGNITDMRQYCRIITPANAVIMDPLVEPAKSLGWTSIEDHAKSVGSGVPTAKNPHGLIPSDIGFGGGDTATHWQDAHINGIMLLSRTAAATGSFEGSVVSTADDYIVFYPPTNAALVVNGSFTSGSLPNLYASSAPADGDYWVVATSAGTTQFVAKASIVPDAGDPHKYPTYLILGSCSVSGTMQDITNFCDMREFFAMSQEDIRADFVEATSDPTGTLLRTATLVDNLNRIRGQIQNAKTFLSMSANLATGSIRDFNTVYQNTSTLPMFVTVSTLISEYRVELLIGNNASLASMVDTISVIADTSGVGWVGNVSGMVPPGYYYEVITAGTGTISLQYWREST